MKIVIEQFTSIVINEIELGWIVKCGHCNGTGVEPTYDTKTCTSCNGIGKRKLLLPNDADLSFNWGPVFCGHCQGTGVEPTYDTKTCTCCDGIGAQVGAFPRVKCGKCGGSGIEPTYDTKTCKGKGCNGRGTVHIDHIR